MSRYPVATMAIALALFARATPLWAQGWSSDSTVNTPVAVEVGDGSVGAQDKKGGGGSGGGKCGSVGLDLMLPLALLWFVRRCVIFPRATR